MGIKAERALGGGDPEKKMLQYVVPGDVVANLTQDLTEVDSQLERVQYGLDRMFWLLLVCAILSGILVIYDSYTIYRNCFKKEKYHDVTARASECDDNRV